MILITRPDFPTNNLKELVERIRSWGDKMTIGKVGPGSASQPCGLMFMSTTGTTLTSVYYKAGGPAQNDLIAGHIDVYCNPAIGPTPHIQSGTTKGYEITSKKRVPTLPKVPKSPEAASRSHG